MKELELIFKGGFEVEDKVQIGNFEIVKISNIGLTMELSYDNGILVHTNIYQNEKIEISKNLVLSRVKSEIDAICYMNNISKEYFFKTRKKPFIYYKFALAYIMQYHNFTYNFIGKQIGMKDHSTIMNQVNECRKAFDGYNPELKQEIEAMMQKLEV